MHTITTFHRLLDVVSCVESDPRVQLVFTVAPDAFNHDVEPRLRELGAIVLSWPQARAHHFDLALAAAHGGLHELHAPLVVMAHGAGRGKFVRPAEHGGPLADQRVVYGLDRQRLTRDGRVLASAIMLSHDNEREVLRRQCPEALAVSVVAGDPCFDRLVSSLPWRARYRDALHVGDRQHLVVASSTWGPDGLFGRQPRLLSRLVDQLAESRFRVAALLHPAVWSAHGRRQVRAWLRPCSEAGLLLANPTDDWRAYIIAADYVIGDHGSVTAYAAAIGRRVLHVAGVAPDAVDGSAQELVLTRAARLDQRRPIANQLHTAPDVDQETVAAALTSRPGNADHLMSDTLYRLLKLTRPAGRVGPVPVPVPITEAPGVRL